MGESAREQAREKSGDDGWKVSGSRRQAVKAVGEEVTGCGEKQAAVIWDDDDDDDTEEEEKEFTLLKVC